jgi:hypothetical protein
MDVAQDRGFAELGRRSRVKFLRFRLEDLTSEASVALGACLRGLLLLADPSRRR